MAQYGSALSLHPVPTTAVGEVTGQLLESLAGSTPDFVVAFVSPQFAGAFDDICGTIRAVLEPRNFIACTAVSIIGGAREVEEQPAISAFAAVVPDARITPVRLDVVDTPDGPTVTGWPELASHPATLLLLADPYTFPVDAFLRRVDDDQPGVQVIGGLASAASRPGGNFLALDGTIINEGAVGLALEGISVTTVVSQGCRPIGHPFVVTRGERNFIEELAGRPALDRVRELAQSATDDERELLTRGLHVGLVVDEHKVEFARGDFLIRNVLGADQRTGAVAVGDHVHVGQTLQFQVRDAAAADEDLRALLGGHRAEAALLFTCNGRGRHLFGVADHDAGLVADLLGSVPVAGMFCAGEIGPVGGRNFLHGFTASLALFG